MGVADEKGESRMERCDLTAKNRAAWDEAAPVHAETQLERLVAEAGGDGFRCLDPVIKEALQEAGVAGGRVAQVACNNGRELLSTASLGATGGTGFDISQAFISQAVELAEAMGADDEWEFVCSDAYEIPSAYHGLFDLVFTSVGVLGWMPDIGGFFEVLARLLRPGGQLLTYEIHPVLGMYEPDRSASGESGPPAPASPYFTSEPFSDTSGLDYWTGTAYESAPYFWFQHTLGDIVSACAKAGLRIVSLAEYDHDISRIYTRMQATQARPPLCFLLRATRPAGA